MDEFRAFFNNRLPSDSQPTKLRGPLTGGMRVTKDNPIDQLNRREEHRYSVMPRGTDYAREAKERETELYLKNETERENAKAFTRGLESLEDLSLGASVQNVDELADAAMNEVYNKYSFKEKPKNNLPIVEYKQTILDMIKSLPVVIIEGPTGCGKTTQVPQWILEDCYNNRKPCKIIVTQPRRIAAISIAKRVGQERGWDVGGVVGYQVGLENNTSSDTCIHYVTNGILLQKLVSTKTMDEYTHIILDEVHERGQEMDFLLLVVRKLLYTVSRKVKVVLMSATFDSKAFADYFEIPTSRGREMSPCVKIVKTDSIYPLKIFYLNHLQKIGTINRQEIEKNELTIAPEMYHFVIKLVNAFELIDKLEELDLPSVLVFLPGINEIEELYECLTNIKLRVKVAGQECAKYKWLVLPLHSTITADEQVRVFLPASDGSRKIILATNIAESSITVPDVKYVVDFCRMKQLVADPDTNFTMLQLAWASKTNCEQRAGRAGRVREGRVYRLVQDKFYESLNTDSEPEMLRCPLERLVLLAKMLDMGPPSDILALAMNPPEISNIHRTILVLKEIGAMKKTVNGKWSNSDGDITYLGRIMAKLPLDVKVSKLIMLGYIFGVLDQTVVMAAAMSVKNIFSCPFRERLNAYNSKLTWANGSTSDCIAFYHVYKVWCHMRKQKQFRESDESEPQWARRFYVQLRALRELGELVRELRARLSREGIDTPHRNSPWDAHELPLVYKVVIAGAFYPQYFVQVTQDDLRERDAVRVLGGLDPRTTVYLKNFPTEQPGEIYAATIKKVVQQYIGDEPRVTFDKNSQKVYLTFDDGSLKPKKDENEIRDPAIPGQVLLPVYKAVKARQLRMDIRVPLLPLPKAKALAAAFSVEKSNFNMETAVPRLPDIDETHFPLKISNIMSVSKFWVQYDDESTASELQRIYAVLNRAPLVAYTGEVRAGALLAAPCSAPGGACMKRARVLRLLPRDMLEVLYIDDGICGSLNAGNLRELPAGAVSSVPPLAMQCVLAELAPSRLLEPRAHWTHAAQNLFFGLVSRGRLLGKVYSVVQGVISIELFAEGGKISVNQELLKKGFAIPCEESYDSKLNHDLRQTVNELNMSQKRAFNKEQVESAYFHMRELEPPSARDCVSDVCLKGPHSPLETGLHSLMYSTREKAVNIEWNSVNSVLLDTEPQEVYERMVVAADVGQSETTSSLTLRHTTVMPNIPGLPAILALLFCPVAEMRRSADACRYVSALCGLGAGEAGEVGARDTPLFPEHDLLVNIDADLDIDDLGLINHIRHLMDYMMYCSDGQDMPTADNEFTADVPKFIREDLMKLLMKRRKHREGETVLNAWEWKSIPENEVLEINVPEMVERSVVYPLHAPLELRPPSREILLKQKQENDHLKLLVTRTPISSNSELACKLCGTGMMPAHAMRIHLYSNAHKEKEEDFRIFQS